MNKKTDKESFELCIKSAEQGDINAQNALDSLYIFNNYQENAKKWYEKAAEQGYEEARTRLDSLQ